MITRLFSFELRQTNVVEGRTSRRGGARSLGIILLAIAAFLAWRSNWFQAEPDLSRYPQIQLTYTNCKFERISHYRGSTTKQIVFLTDNGRYVMEAGVWGRHFNGPTLAAALAGGGTVRAWVHPGYPHVIRGVTGGKANVPPEWGLAYDQRNANAGIWVDAFLALAATILFFWKR